ncbi:MAG: ABC transporter ATP-binding protein [Lachnospiraceae bacterium]
MLTIEHINAFYGKKEVLHDISISFQSNKIYSIIGKNGSGKSSLLKSIIGLMNLKSGSIKLNDYDLLDMAPKIRAQNISYLSQHRTMSNILVEQIVTHGRHPYIVGNDSSQKKLHEKVIADALYTMNLENHRFTPLSNLSGGELQRAYIAMVLAQDTPIVIFDEPTTFMDIDYQIQFLNLIKKLKSYNKTIILVLHDIPSAFEISDEILVMDQGEIKCMLPPFELIKTNFIPKYFNVKILFENEYFRVIPLLKT